MLGGMQRDERLDYWGDVAGYYEGQAEAALSLVEAALEANPPQLPETRERRMAFVMLDAVLHEPSAYDRRAVRGFIQRAASAVANGLAGRSVSEGALIWKVYDAAFVVRTASVTIGFDLSRATYLPRQAIPDEVMATIIDSCDALLVSHEHEDHADAGVASRFIAQGKPVLAPSGVWGDGLLADKLIRPPRRSDRTERLALSGDGSVLDVVAFPGHQGENVENNVYLASTPEGLSFLHSGDQSRDADFAWIDTVWKRARVDVVFPNCWTPNPGRFIRGIRPGLVIPAHENELGHTIDHREAYWLTERRMAEVEAPSLRMSWGEAYHYHPDRRPADDSALQ